MPDLSTDAAPATANPLLTAWDTPFGAPPFASITATDFRPAFDAALAEHDAEIAAIADNPEPPTFTNTIAALERAGHALDRVSGVFFNLTGAHTNDALQAVEREIAPLLARHRNAIMFNAALFRRIDAVAAAPTGLSDEEARLLARTHLGFKRAGAGLTADATARLSAIGERLAVLGTRFGQNVLADETAYALFLDGPDDLDGLPESLRADAAQAARERDQDGRHAITLSRSSIEPFLQFSRRRDLREQAFRAWSARGEAGATDNRPIIAEMVALRAERARLLGYPSFAHFKLDDTMAKTPDAALALLRNVWGHARRRALRERETLQSLARETGHNDAIEPWDWRFFAEQVRLRDYGIDEAAIKPYLQLDRMREAAFDTATRLFGVTFRARDDVPVYHPDVRAYSVDDRDGRAIGLFLVDDFARPSKRSGAWMSAFRVQEALDGPVLPIIVNVMNFSKPAEGSPALISFDDARTLFHEFGHALHGLLSDVTFPSLSGTSVSRDFVEFPSQLYEHWLERPEVLSRFATHWQTNEPMPAELLRKILAARTFNQGFSTVEYTASALLDLAFHMVADPADAADVGAFETRELKAIGMPDGMTMRHRPPHFAHVFAGDGYSAGYYSYLWSEVLDADGFAAFEEAGDIYDPAVAQRLKTFVYAAGNRRDPEAAYRAFRGRLPAPEALLRKRGFEEAPVQGEA